MTILNFTTDDRLAVIAPHPDDETLGAGAAIIRAREAGAAVRVLFLTDGDRNDWPQRVAAKKLRITPEIRKRWGEKRRAEALKAVETLGLKPDSAEFCALPDLGLTTMLLQEPQKLLDAFRGTAKEFRPTILLSPYSQDLHPDHNAAALALKLLGVDENTRKLEYAVHGKAAEASVVLELTSEERAQKLTALLCHESQMLLSRKRFTRYVTDKETFISAGESSRHPCASFRFSDGVLTGKFPPRIRLRRAKLFVLWKRKGGEIESKVLPMRKGYELEVGDASEVWVKFSYRPVFLDRAGWWRA